MPTRGLNFDTLLTCDSDRECSVTHLNVFRYSNTKLVKNTSQNGSKLTLTPKTHSLPSNPRKILHNAMRFAWDSRLRIIWALIVQVTRGRRSFDSGFIWSLGEFGWVHCAVNFFVFDPFVFSWFWVHLLLGWASSFGFSLSICFVHLIRSIPLRLRLKKIITQNKNKHF